MSLTESETAAYPISEKAVIRNRVLRIPENHVNGVIKVTKSRSSTIPIHLIDQTDEVFPALIQSMQISHAFSDVLVRSTSPRCSDSECEWCSVLTVFQDYQQTYAEDFGHKQENFHE
ncbi:hypothetical protein Tco_0250327 [Tanacetum coccineum]